MKKKLLLPLAMVLVSTIMFQSCIGSFSLTNKVLNWNRHVNNKFVNELVFFAFWILPVYEVTAVADLLVINSIEFWSGNQPLEANNKVITTDHGDYMIMARADGYDLLSPDGNKINFRFDSKNQVWSMGVNGSQQMDFIKFKDSSHVEMINPSGEFVDVELSREGVDAYAIANGLALMASY